MKREERRLESQTRNPIHVLEQEDLIGTMLTINNLQPRSIPRPPFSKSLYQYSSLSDDTDKYNRQDPNALIMMPKKSTATADTTTDESTKPKVLKYTS